MTGAVFGGAVFGGAVLVSSSRSDPADATLAGVTVQNANQSIKRITVHTDGSCLGNPGAGGWAAVLEYLAPSGTHKTLELSGGEAGTTNNRMELMAAIGALEALKEPCAITIRTDSKYVQHAFTKRWLEGWQRNGWITSTKQPVKNKDLWLRLLALTRTHQVQWDWTKGHAGDPLNERCDVLARTAAKKFL